MSKSSIKQLIKKIIPLSFLNSRIKIKFYILNFINRKIKKKNYIFIYSSLGFRDNARSLYDYLILNGYNNKYKIICSVDDAKLYKNINIKNVKFINKSKGVFYYIISKYCFYSFGMYSIKPSPKQIVINLWHGMPLKKIGNLEAESDKDYNHFSYVIATSCFFSNIMQEAFNCREDQVLISGQPRNDELFIKNSVKEKLNLKDYRKIIIWLPTFRKSSRLKTFDTSNDKLNELSFPLVNSTKKMFEINKLLKKDKSVLLIKPHPMQDLQKNDLEEHSNIIVKTQDDLIDNDITLYNILKETDALITDYSSVYFDYLLLDRPIGFTVDDIEDYKKIRGFVVPDPYEIMPGEKIKDFNSFCKFIENTLKDEDLFISKRKEINNLCNKYIDGNNSKRILDFCGINLELVKKK